MIIEIIKMAFESLLAKKTRSFLSMLGIIIGVSTVIAVFAIGQGAKKAVNDQFAGLSAKSIMVMGNMGRPGSTASSKLKIGDVKAVKEKAVHIALATGIVEGSATASYDGNEESYSVIGTDLDFFKIANQKLSAGRMFTDEEINSKERLVILGSDVASELYSGKSEIVGTTITVSGKKLEVIGYFEETGGSMGRVSKDEAIYFPYQTAQGSILGDRGGRLMITLEADSVENIKLATEELTQILRAEHRLKEDQEDDFRIMDAGSMVSAAQDSAALMSTVLTLVAAITLLVSGIGIMNVMFVTVAERTKEIGIAKAIGGKKGDILMQFLLESIILSTIGGIIGIIIGQSAIPLIAKFDLMAMSSSASGPLLGFSFSVLVGVFFGFYPALKASKLDPVDALRSE